MPGLTEDRNTPRQGAIKRVYDAIDTVALFAGGMYTLGAQGFAKPSVAADKKPVRAVCNKRVAFPNDSLVEGERGIFGFDNSAGVNKITRADIGAYAYVEDDHTVAKAGTSIVGEIVDVTGVAVWVDVGKAIVPTTA